MQPHDSAARPGCPAGPTSVQRENVLQGRTGLDAVLGRLHWRRHSADHLPPKEVTDSPLRPLGSRKSGVSLFEAINETAEALATAGTPATRLEVSAPDWILLREAIWPPMRPMPDMPMAATVTRLMTTRGPVDVRPGERTALCWHRPGKIGRYEIVPWNRMEIA